MLKLFSYALFIQYDKKLNLVYKWNALKSLSWAKCMLSWAGHGQVMSRVYFLGITNFFLLLQYFVKRKMSSDHQIKSKIRLYLFSEDRAFLLNFTNFTKKSKFSRKFSKILGIWILYLGLPFDIFLLIWKS